MAYYGGILGGATRSEMVILTSEGKMIGKSEGPCLNPHSLGQGELGVEECAKRINELVVDAKANAGLNQMDPLRCLGATISGGDTDDIRRKIENTVGRLYPSTSRTYKICTDTYGSIATADPGGGVVLIAGTGSNCRLINPDGSEHGCGGWGGRIGDDGSAYWIVQRAVKIVYDALDGMEKPPHDITFLKEKIYSYFDMETAMDIIPHFYEKFEKAKVAGLCKVMAEEGKKDRLCQHVFHSAGYVLGRHIRAIAPNVDQRLLQSPGGLQIICDGSVWNSWNLLKDGFLEALYPAKGEPVSIKEFTLVQLKKSPAIGAALLGAAEARERLSVDYSDNVKSLYHRTE
eukprot:m.309444 g.309444  ORF g.309444 m.309444 type:complete len:345 (+) comp46508_c0_seq1:90-1124(+)